MPRKLPLSWFWKGSWLLASLSLFPLSSAFAQGNYKGEGALPAQQYYKGEEEVYMPPESKYSGQVYNSDLYQGAVRGPGYSPDCNRALHDGVYVGIEGGYDSYKIRESLNTTVTGSANFQQNPDLSANGLSYTGVMGFGKVFDNPLYLGAEVFYNNSFAQTSENVGVTQGGVSGIYYIKAEIEQTYGVSLIPGFKLTDSTLLYLKGGYTRTQVKNIESSALLGVNNSQSLGVNGVHYGLGLEVTLYKPWSLRGEYTHMNGQNISYMTGTLVTPSNNQVMLGLIFHLT